MRGQVEPVRRRASQASPPASLRRPAAGLHLVSWDQGPPETRGAREVWESGNIASQTVKGRKSRLMMLRSLVQFRLVLLAVSSRLVGNRKFRGRVLVTLATVGLTAAAICAARRFAHLPPEPGYEGGLGRGSGWRELEGPDLR